MKSLGLMNLKLVITESLTLSTQLKKKLTIFISLNGIWLSKTGWRIVKDLKITWKMNSFHFFQVSILYRNLILSGSAWTSWTLLKCSQSHFTSNPYTIDKGNNDRKMQKIREVSWWWDYNVARKRNILHTYTVRDNQNNSSTQRKVQEPVRVWKIWAQCAYMDTHYVTAIWAAS